jgi:disulfide bond formation protein DsbB
MANEITGYMNGYLVIAKRDPALAAAAIVAGVGLLTICGFVFFEYVLGYPPCPLCLDQRNAFYVSVPLAALLCLGASYGASRKVMIAGFAVITAVMLWNAGLSAYHAGVEWKLWAGPNDCSGPINNFGSAGNLLKQLQNIRIVRCDEAAWRLLGISLAGYDVLISLFLAAIAAWGLRASLARRSPAR